MMNQFDDKTNEPVLNRALSELAKALEFILRYCPEKLKEKMEKTYFDKGFLNGFLPNGVTKAQVKEHLLTFLSLSIQASMRVEALNLNGDKLKHLNESVNKVLSSVKAVSKSYDINDYSELNIKMNELGVLNQSNTALYVMEETRKLESLSKNANDIAIYASKGSLSGAYWEVVGKEQFQLNVFRASALIFMVLIVVAWVLFYLNIVIIVAIEWEGMMGLSFVTSVLAAYLAREAAKHQKKYDLYVQKYLDLAYLDPFIKNLSENKQSEVKVEFAKRFFGCYEKSGEEKASYPINVQELVLELIKKMDFKSKTPEK